ncbi:MAG TPA: winged helix DNA-binding domain-containing protein [Actinoplanes sp.]
MRRFTWRQASAQRLVRHHLTDSTRIDDPARISADMLGVHAQVMSAAVLSIGIRSATLAADDIRAALWTTGTLVKSRGPRGTVHLLAAEDLPMWTAALSALPARSSPFPPDVRMSERQTDAVVAAIDDAVQDAELTVDELTDAIVARAGSWAGDRVMEAFQDKWPRWRQAESLAMNRGVLCFGPDRARRATYMSPRRWLPAPMSADAALAELLRRFLYAYGPATPVDFARWLGVSPTWATGLFAGQDDLEEVDFEGRIAWATAGDGATVTTSVRLLPYFDAYVIGCHPRATLFPGVADKRALTGGQAGNVPVLLVDGVVAGVWHQRKSGRRIAITVEPLARLSGRQRSDVESEADRVGRIAGGTAETTFGTVSVGPHA